MGCAIDTGSKEDEAMGELVGHGPARIEVHEIECERECDDNGGAHVAGEAHEGEENGERVDEPHQAEGFERD